ncbi:uncharacterized protein LOC142164008 [Nicotiana tabacum]|uniref:Uncharacterized protein LOC142164008 n=1 Tax=Nicotiana tabacum TaxID=4097 RepID=A0AC58RWZ1_TOBAC
MARTMLIDSGVPKSFWAEVVNTACYLINRCMIRSLLNKTPYEMLNGRKPKLTYLRPFGCKCFILNNGKEAVGKFDDKSDEGIFLGYFSQSKVYKVYNKMTQCVEESIYVIIDEAYHSSGKYSHDKNDQDGDYSKVHGEVIDMENGKADLMSQVKETSTPDAEQRSYIHSSIDANDRSHMAEPGIQTISKARNIFAFSPFFSQIELKYIKETLKYADWIVAIQEELHQF